MIDRVNVYLGSVGPLVAEHCDREGIPMSAFIRVACEHAIARGQGIDSIARAERAIETLERAVSLARTHLGKQKARKARRTGG